MSIESFRILMEKAKQMEVIENHNQASKVSIPGQSRFPSQTRLKPSESATLWGDITVKNQLDRDLDIKIHFNPFDKKGFNLEIYDALTHELIMEKKCQVHEQYVISETNNNEISLLRKNESAKKSLRQLRNFGNFA